MDLESAKEQQLYVQNILSKDFATQEALLSRQEKNFKNAKVIRYDVDTTKNQNGHLKLLEKFKKMFS